MARASDEWVKWSACLAYEPTLWDADGNTPETLADINDAIEVCHRCPVARECLREAMAAEWGKAAKYRYVIYGGLTGAERWYLERKWRKAEPTS